jgi:aminoglycoside 6-adenylyltransferase
MEEKHSSPSSLEEMLDRFVAWAEAQPDILAAVVIGSRAREERPADEWSDLDLLVVAADPERYLSRTDWLQAVGSPWVTFLERTIVGTQERRVLFEGGLDVDFNLFSRAQFEQLRAHAEVSSAVIRRGVRVLLDREGLARTWAESASNVTAPHPPGEADFQSIVHEFWYRAVWTAKKLRRGELFIAKQSCDCGLKRLLREMMEWHARATHGWEYDTWHDGRFLEQWADPRALAELAPSFAAYDAADLVRALPATVDLFRWLARETAERLGFAYPDAADQHATEWLRACLTRDE